MKSIILFAAFIGFSSIGRTQSVIASGQEPAWTLDYDGGKNLVLYVGENSFAYTLVSKPGPEGSSKEIAESWVMKGENGKTAVLVMEFFDPESAESCPCFHDLGEGLNRGKAYMITENAQFYIGCGEFLEEPVSSNH
ncbi:MAG: hypothetical protein LW701_06425 [Fluviicola sp.]|jgi:hypothetical protein|nr:hypothetical protein [Fluviicola sp.]